MTRTPLPLTQPLTVFYNGACPICRAEIHHYRSIAMRRGLDTLIWRDLSQEPEILAPYDLTPEQAKRRLYTADTKGALYSGVDSFIAIWDRLPGYRWLARLTRLSIIRPIAGWTYDRLAVPVLAWLNKRRENKASRDDTERSGRI